MAFAHSGAAIILPFDKKYHLWQPDSIKAKPMGGSTLSNSPLTPVSLPVVCPTPRWPAISLITRRLLISTKRALPLTGVISAMTRRV
jgi:hypothetical protein